MKEYSHILVYSGLLLFALKVWLGLRGTNPTQDTPNKGHIINDSFHFDCDKKSCNMGLRHKKEDKILYVMERTYNRETSQPQTTTKNVNPMTKGWDGVAPQKTDKVEGSKLKKEI